MSGSGGGMGGGGGGLGGFGGLFGDPQTNCPQHRSKPGAGHKPEPASAQCANAR
jgi:hypothetical protein